MKPYANVHDRLCLTRRTAVAVLTGGGLTLLLGGYATERAAAEGASVVPACVVRPQQIEGPYFVDEQLQRSDIRSDPANGAVQPGVPLQLTFMITRLRGNTCTPLASAQVDVWQCNA